MGLTNATTTFMGVVNNLFTNLLGRGIIVFLDDVLVYRHTWDKHIQLLHMVFDKLHEHRFYCKLKKFSFFRMTTMFLGLDVTPDRLKISDTKVKSLCDWPLPTTMKKVQSFLVFVQYF